MADTMGSTETDSTSELHKLYIEDKDNLYVACAGTVEMAAEVISLFKQGIAKVASRTHGAIWDALNKAVHEHRMTHFTWDVGSRAWQPHALQLWCAKTRSHRKSLPCNIVTSI
jgi:hypothetical protein